MPEINPSAIERAKFFNETPELSTKEERAQLRAAQARWDALRAQTAPLSAAAFDEKLDALKGAYRNDPSQENFNRLFAADHDREQFQKKSAIQREEVFRVRQAVALSCHPIVARILMRASEYAAEKAAGIRLSDQSYSSGIGIPWIPSPLQLFAEQLAQSLKVSAEHYAAGTGPIEGMKAVLAGIVDIAEP